MSNEEAGVPTYSVSWRVRRVPVEEYARFCRYLVARYGAQPAVWLAGADGSGREPQVEAGGREIQQWDCSPFSRIVGANR